jgi:alpha-D-ribose 1-methylphosphonate 5-triphosphate synthase subunit PhnG
VDDLVDAVVGASAVVADEDESGLVMVAGDGGHGAGSHFLVGRASRARAGVGRVLAADTWLCTQ